MMDPGLRPGARELSRAYAVARVRGARAHLLGRRGLYELAALAEPAPRLELLRRHGLCSAAATTLSDAERELAEGLRREADRVAGWLDGTRAAPAFRTSLAIADAGVLKTILRGVTRGEPPARLLAWVVPPLELDPGALRELAAQRSARGVVEVLASWASPYAPSLLAAAATGDGRLDLPALELAVDRVALARAAAAARRAGAEGRPLARMVAELVDLTNAVTLLELSGKAGARELFLEGGRVLGRRRFERLAALPAAGAHAALVADRALALEPAFVDGAPDPFRIDRLVRLRPLAALRRAAREDPLSLAVLVLYVLERREEVRAVRLVLEGREVGLPAGELVDLAEAGVTP